MVKTKENVFKPVIKRYYELFRFKNPKFKFPIAMFLISFAQVIFYWTNKDNECSLETVFKFCVCNGDDVWRLIFYMFIHNSLPILLMNVFIQLLIAIPLEPYHSWWRITVVYFCGGLGGSLGHTLMDYRESLVGASPGVKS
jgi:membrane associated rhomboid family serine protease